jgi:hypothetical protein
MADERRGRTRAIGAELPRIAGPVLGKHGFGEAQLLQHWASIIGDKLAEGTMPEKLTFLRGERRDGTLHLVVASGLAPEIQHREPVLLERINAFFGYRAVARLTLRQGLPSRSRNRGPKLPRPLEGAEASELDRRVAEVPDPELRAALRRLGAAVIGSEKQ